MELDSALQVLPGQLLQQKFDAFIAVSGYESRCAHLAAFIDIESIPVKIVLAFKEKKELLYRGINDDFFSRAGFEFCNVSSCDAGDISQILDRLCSHSGREELNILVDYSSMPKIWYSELLNYFNDLDEIFRNVRIWFSYSPSEFTPSISAITNKYIDSVKARESGKPVVLILGLGYEKGRAEELAGLLNAKHTYAFYANPAIDDRYVEEVLENNKNVLKNIHRDQIIPYPIDDLNSINEALTQLCIKLRMDHQVVLVPVGPKPFTLMCFILASRYPDILIYRVSSVIETAVTDRRAKGEILVYQLNYTAEEVDY